ncbi:MAG: CDC27 family protein [Bacteroidota bacterium]
MLNPKDISIHKQAGKEQQRSLENNMQQDELSYLSSVAFEQFNVRDSEIQQLTQSIDKRTMGNNSSFNTIFISVLSGLLIGLSIFFVIFQKSKNHPSIFQTIEEEQAANALNNTVKESDTIFPVIEPKIIEHYNTIADKVEEPVVTVDVPEVLPSKGLTLPVAENKEEEDIVYQFTANAPVIFIDNLKVTNYRLYYFKQSEAINLSINTGVAAQYESKADIQRPSMNSSNTYLAHKVIRKAMRLFNSGDLANCIEELTILYNYNKDDANAQFYLGMCYYQLGKYAVAQTYFQKNLGNANNIFHQESEFYEALCLLNTKQVDEASGQLKNIVNNKGFYSQRAQEIINKQLKN